MAWKTAVRATWILWHRFSIDTGSSEVQKHRHRISRNPENIPSSLPWIHWYRSCAQEIVPFREICWVSGSCRPLCGKTTTNKPQNHYPTLVVHLPCAAHLHAYELAEKSQRMVTCLWLSLRSKKNRAVHNRLSSELCVNFNLTSSFDCSQTASCFDFSLYFAIFSTTVSRLARRKCFGWDKTLITVAGMFTTSNYTTHNFAYFRW